MESKSQFIDDALRKKEEQDFHDRLRAEAHEQRWSPDAEARVADNPLWSNFKYYSVEQHSLEVMREWIQSDGIGRDVLDYCCGNGDEALFLAQQGARSVTGIDISEVSIANCNQRARGLGLAEIAKFQTMDAEALTFADDSFDLIMEYGVLHHLKLDAAMAELARVLRPGGSIVCTETLGHNPLIRRYRRRTPHLRTAWEAEHILTRASFEIIERHFGKSEKHFFHLATLAAVPFRNLSVFPHLLRVLRGVDSAILSLPHVQWHAWQVVFRLSEPRKMSKR